MERLQSPGRAPAVAVATQADSLLETSCPKLATLIAWATFSWRAGGWGCGAGFESTKLCASLKLGLTLDVGIVDLESAGRSKLQRLAAPMVSGRYPNQLNDSAPRSRSKATYLRWALLRAWTGCGASPPCRALGYNLSMISKRELHDGTATRRARDAEGAVSPTRDGFITGSEAPGLAV